MLRKLKNLCKYQLPRIQEGFVSLTIEVTKEIMINLFIYTYYCGLFYFGQACIAIRNEA